MKRSWRCLFVFICLLLVWSVLPLGKGWTGELPAGVEPLQVKQMRVTAYTKAFAKRFGLPEPQAGYELSEEGGLQAIEYAVEEGPPRSPFYLSVFKLYVKDNLLLHLPEEGSVGRQGMVNGHDHFFGETQEMFMRWAESDRRFTLKKLINYSMKVIMATKGYEWGKKGSGSMTSMHYEEYHANFIPGIIYVKIYDYQPLSGYFTKEKGHGKEVEIWLKRKNKSNYSDEQPIKSEDFYKFTFPGGFYKKSLALDVIARNKNDVIRQKQQHYKREGL
jgi:hypothetical protein